MFTFTKNLSFQTLSKLFAISILSLFISSCQNDPATGDQNPKVEIRQVDGEYNFYVDGELFPIKGAGLDFNQGTNFKGLAEAGANSFRTWRTNDAPQELDSAVKYNLKVALGLDMDKELHDFDYHDTVAVREQFERIKKEVMAYKDHPNLLCWVAGNELNLAFNEDGSLKIVDPLVYDALNDIVNFIKEVDPNHPVTTTFAAGAIKEHIEPVLERCPNLDFLSYQVYGDLQIIIPMVEKSGVKKPYLVTEFGPKGHWEMPSTSWGREIEETTSLKASGLWDRMQNGLEADETGLSMGGFAFIWGQKQERTPTWYGMFNKDGRGTEVIDELTRYWTGEYPEDRAPKVDSIKLDGKKATDNVYLSPGTEYSAKVFAYDLKDDSLSFKWTIMEEVMEKSDGGAFEAEPAEIEMDIKRNENGEITFTTPSEPGEYRLFAYVYDKEKVGNANIPFYVK